MVYISVARSINYIKRQKEKKIEPQTEIKPSPSKKFSMKRQTKARKKTVSSAEPPKKASSPKSKTQSTAAESRAETGNKPYTIQVAAFKAAADADKLVAKLKQKGFSAYRKLDKIPNRGIWYRVRVGEYKDKAEASSTMAKLKKAGQDAILVKK